MSSPEIPLGLHALVWVGDWTAQSAKHAISSTAALGFDLIEIPLLDPSSIDTAMTRALLDEYGLGAACSLGLDPDADVSSEDPAVVARGRDLLAQAVDATAAIGASDLCGVLYSVLAKYPGPISERSRAHVVESMAWLAERAQGSGLRVNLEVVNRYETNVANTTAEMLGLIDETGVDLGIHLDTYHVNIEENGFVEPVHQAVDAGRLRYVHVGESHRGYLGTGSVDFLLRHPARGGVLRAGGLRELQQRCRAPDPVEPVGRVAQPVGRRGGPRAARL